MAQVILNVEKNRSTGSANARRARSNGLIPGVLYGKEIASESISISAKDLRDALSTDAGHNVLLDLRIDDKSHVAIIKEVQVHKVKRIVTHVDIMVVSTDQEITAVVPLSLVGEPHELTRAGGRLNQILREVTVRAAATKIPNVLEYDITHMQVGDHIKVDDIPGIEGVIIETEPEVIIAVGELPRGAAAVDTEQAPANQ